MRPTSSRLFFFAPYRLRVSLQLRVNACSSLASDDVLVLTLQAGSPEAGRQKREKGGRPASQIKAVIVTVSASQANDRQIAF